MKSKKSFLFALGTSIFLSGLIFLLPDGARADYPATLSGGINFNNYVCFADNEDGGCISGAYTSSVPFPGSEPIGAGFDSNSNAPYGCSDLRSGLIVGGNVDSDCIEGYVSSGPISGLSYMCAFTNWDSNSCTAAAYMAGSSGTYGGSYTCPSGGTLSGTTCITDNGCAATTCNTTTCWNNLSWVAGTKVCADNSCAANTCTTATCWNNLTWIAGTKTCDNGCAANTCSTTTCNNGISVVQGTKVCDNGCAANTCSTTTCFNGIATVQGTKVCDNGCAATTCNTTTCWNNLSWVTGTKSCPTDNGCAANTCSTTTCNNGIGIVQGTKLCDNGCAANTCTTATCFNGISTVQGTKPVTYSGQACNQIDSLDCSIPSNCGKTDTVVKACIGTNDCTGSTGVSTPGQCGAGCDTTTPVQCPACKSVNPGNWTEVNP